MSISTLKWLFAASVLAAPVLVWAEAPPAETRLPNRLATTMSERLAQYRTPNANAEPDRPDGRADADPSTESAAAPKVEWKVRSVDGRDDPVTVTRHSEPLPQPAPPEEHSEPGLLPPPAVPPAAPTDAATGVRDPSPPIPGGPLTLPGMIDPAPAYPGYSLYPGDGVADPARGVSGVNLNPCGECFSRRTPPEGALGRRSSPGFDVPYAGSCLRSAMNAQVVNALGNQLVLYHYDFEQGASQLSLRGKRQLAKYAPRAIILGRPIVIEPTPGLPARDEARRNNVIRALTELDPTSGEFWADGRVVVAQPAEPGLRGEEALSIDENLLGRTQSGSTLETSGDSGDSNLPSPIPMY